MHNLLLAASIVVIELFTSQGCSSCPPADELLRTIARDPALQGKVIPLAFHVDYWNHLGWRDPFSSKEWSMRQMGYVRAMQLSSAYTPQAVVNGDQQLVGSNKSALTVNGDEVVVTAESRLTNLEAIVLVVENRITTHVAAGENEGRNLVSERIVRQLVRAGRAPARARIKAIRNGEVIVLLQDPSTLRIHAATVVK